MQRTDNGDAPSAAGLKHVIQIPFSGNFQKLCTVSGNQFFVGCAYTFFCQKGSLCKGIGRLHTSHHFHHNSHFRIVYNHVKIVNNLLLHRVSRKIPQIQYIFDVDLIACFFGDAAVIGVDDFYNAGPYGSVS